MLCEVLLVKTIGERQYATVKAGHLVGELPIAKGVVIEPGDKASIVPHLGAFQGRLQAHLVLTK